MSQSIYGDLNVKRTLNVDRRANQGLNTETITGVRTVTINDFAWLNIVNATTQDVVLPSALTLTKGWSITVSADPTSGASVNIKTYDAVTPALLKNVLVGRAYYITCYDISSAAGLWNIDLITQSDSIPAERHVDTFNATSDWTGPSNGYYTRTVTAATHTQGTSPEVTVNSGAGPYTKVMPDSVSVAANGDITIQVTQTPDLRFAGQMIIV